MWGLRLRGDEQIILSVLGGHREHYGVLVQRYLPVVQAIARAQLGTRHDMDDVAQEAFIRAYLHLDQLRDRSQFAPWLASIARNVAIGLGRQRTRETAAVEALKLDVPAAVGPPDHANKELRRAIRAEVDALEPLDREALLLTYFAGKRSREVAEILEISDAAARKRIERARTALGQRLLTHVEDLSPRPHAQKETAAKILATTLATVTIWRAEAATGTGTGATLAIGGMGAIKALLAVAAICAVGAGAVYLSKMPEQTPRGTTPRAMAPAAESHSAKASPAKAETGSAGPANASTVRADESAPPAGIPFRGHVQHPDGTPVPGATVTGAYWTMNDDAPEPNRLTTTADQAGEFTLYLSEPWEKFLAWADADQHARLKGDEFSVPESGFDGAILTLYRASSISGKVVDKTQKPLANMPVLARNSAISEMLWSEKTRTDDSGNYTVGKLIPGQYDLSVVENETDVLGRAPELTAVVIAENTALTGIDLVFDGGTLAIRGRITAKRDGTPLKNASVEVRDGGTTPRYAHSDEDGNYTIDHLSGENAELVIHADHYQYQSGSAMPGETADFQLDGLGSVSGQVIDAKSRQPIQFFEIGAVGGKTATAHEARFSLKSHTDAAGHFTVAEVNLNEATIVCRAPGFQPAFELVSLAPDEQKSGLVIALEAGLQLNGAVVTSNRTPVENAYVIVGDFTTAYRDKAELIQYLDEEANAKTGADGAFALSGLADGAESITAYHPVLGQTTIVVDLPASGPLNLILDGSKTGTVQGTVTKGGAPVNNVYMIATKPGGKGDAFAQSNTAADGTYQLGDIPVGRVTICALDPFRKSGAYSRLQRDVTLESGDNIAMDFEFPMETGRIEGHATAPDIEKLNGNLTCTVQMEDGTENYMGVMSDGTFILEDMAPGHATLVVNLKTVEESSTNQEYMFRSRRVETEVRPGETSQVAVSFEGTGVIGGVVSGVAPNEFGSVCVLAGNVEITEYNLEVQTNFEPLIRGVSSIGSNGSFRVDGLEPGPYTVFALAHASSSGGALEKARFSTTEVTLNDAQPEVTLNLDVSE